MKKILLAKTSKYTYDKKLKRLVLNWGVLNNIIASAAHSSYAQVTSRTTSFENWPCEYFLRGEDLAEAGFFYTKQLDHIVCFSCNLELGNWRPFDDVDRQHALLSRGCKYLNFKRGQEYVRGQREETEKDSLKCAICFDRPRNTLFIPCSHITACKECSRQLVNCPVCRELIREEKIVYIS